MIIGTGIDIVEVEELSALMIRYGESFGKKVFRESEREYCELQPRKFLHYAARFAAKEAGMKALGSGWDFGIRWIDFEVIRSDSGSPSLLMHGKARAIAQRLEASGWFLTLSHSDRYAIAHVIIEK